MWHDVHVCGQSGCGPGCVQAGQGAHRAQCLGCLCRMVQVHGRVDDPDPKTVAMLPFVLLGAFQAVAAMATVHLPPQ